jgi:iron transport multicopper oxidase
MLRVAVAAVAVAVTAVRAATVTHYFDIGWTTANPDGAFARPVIGINGTWPIPALRAAKGDRILVHATNSLGNQSTSLHFHGMFQNGTNHMDGAAGMTQCAIPPGGRMTYNFTVRASERMRSGLDC